MAIGPNLKRIREARGLKQAELARRSRTPQALLSRLENDIVKDVRSRTLARLADALNVSMDTLTGRDKHVRGPAVSDVVLQTREPPTAAELSAHVQESLDAEGLTADEVFVLIHQEQTVSGYITMLDFKHTTGKGGTEASPNVLDTVVAKALASPLHGCDRLACELHADGIRLSASAVRRRLLASGLSTREQRAEHLKREADAGNITLSGEQEAAMKKIVAAETKKKQTDDDLGEC